ncbi:hypothetical protein [Rhizobium sp. Leaf391]|uniref:hypothetical protein n=1 Tax=Rhizobium sp. Leaf391 TaxID=1736360 RepID=UPI0012E34D36|nr:hypothetical protein [Rhizobium sp. Leaf391]
MKLLFRSMCFLLAVILLSSFKSADPNQEITVQSAYSDHTFVIPRGYFLYPPPLDGNVSKSTAEAFIVDYPNFDFQSENNNRKFREKGSPDIVMFMIRLAPSRPINQFLNMRIQILKKNPVSSYDEDKKLRVFSQKIALTHYQKDLFVDPLGGPNFIECNSPGSVPAPNCQMYFIWDGLTVESTFNLLRIGDRQFIRTHIIEKLRQWKQN